MHNNELILAVVYTLSGVGVLGASKHWEDKGWAWYSVLFPVHSIVISIAEDTWPFVEEVLRWKWWPRALFLLFVWYVLWLGSSL